MISSLPSSLKKRVVKLNSHRFCNKGSYILCILRHTLRAQRNHVINIAIKVANDTSLPLVVAQLVDDEYPYASDRLHSLQVEASKEIKAGLLSKNVSYTLLVGSEMQTNLEQILAKSSAVFIDEIPIQYWSDQILKFKKLIRVPFFSVDSLTLVPMRAVKGDHDSAKSFRAEHKVLRDDYFPREEKLSCKVKYSQRLPGLGPVKTGLAKIINACAIDHSLKSCAEFPGSRKVALSRAREFVEHGIERYRWQRNNPAQVYSTSKLSPYIHYGIIGPEDILFIIDEYEISKSAVWKFKDELLTWRELAFHVSLKNKNFHCFDSIPKWAKKTLRDHRNDKREHIYSLEQLCHAQTQDQLWNFAQLQFLETGWMHNNLRMYWVKQIIKWVQCPEQAYRYAVYLNDRLSSMGFWQSKEGLERS